MQKSEFDLDGKIEFYEVKTKPLDPRRLQSAMFMDRPDLWIKPRRNGQRRTPKEQLRMFDDPEHLYLGLPPQCELPAKKIIKKGGRNT